MRNDSPNRDEMNAIQRDRMERRRNIRRKSAVSTAIFAVVVVAVLAAIIFGVAALVGKNKNHTEPTELPTVSATIAAAVPTQAPTQMPSNNADLQRPQPTIAPYASDPAWQSNDEPAEQDTNEEGDPSGSSQEGGSYINDDNVYIDRNHPAPEQTGTAAEFRFNGAVDGNFYWNYAADNGNFVLSCDYDYNNQQYIFHFFGAEPGTSHVTLYCSDNGVTVPIDLTVNVDDSLNVTVG